MSTVKEYAKAIVAGVTAFAGSYATAISDGNVTTSEWVFAGIATITAAALTFAIPNANYQHIVPVEE